MLPAAAAAAAAATDGGAAAVSCEKPEAGEVLNPAAGASAARSGNRMPAKLNTGSLLSRMVYLQGKDMLLPFRFKLS